MRAAILLCSCFATPALAGELAVGLEAGGALPLGPQAAYFDAGFHAAARAAFTLTPLLDAELRASFVELAPHAGSPLNGPGAAITAGPGLRLGLPRTDELFYPWLDVGASYVRTGPLNRLGFDAGLGVHLRLRAADPAWFGLAFRYVRILGLGNQPGFDSHDASIFLASLSFELEAPKEPADRDADGVADLVDSCPGIPGAPGRTDGCPGPGVVVVTRTSLELGEEISYELGRATLESSSFSILDQVAKVLKDRSALQVRVEARSLTLELAKERAAAIRAYLIGRGIDAARLTIEGYAEKRPSVQLLIVEGSKE